jgi:hypothetical protein
MPSQPNNACQSLFTPVPHSHLPSSSVSATIYEQDNPVTVVALIGHGPFRKSGLTRGSGDIGSAIARVLAQSGADVVVSFVGSPERAQAIVDAVEPERHSAA